MYIYLIRHAKIQTDEDVVQGFDDQIVKDKKTIQIAQDIKSKVGQSDKIYCSGLLRAKQTAEILFPDKTGIVFTNLLNEYERPSRFIGKQKSELIKFWEVENMINKYDPHWKPEDGESYNECATRAEKFYKFLLDDKTKGLSSVAVIGHGTFFRHLAYALCKVEWKEKPQMVIDLLRRFSWDNLEVKTFEL